MNVDAVLISASASEGTGVPVWEVCCVSQLFIDSALISHDRIPDRSDRLEGEIRETLEKSEARGGNASAGASEVFVTSSSYSCLIYLPTGTYKCQVLLTQSLILPNHQLRLFSPSVGISSYKREFLLFSP